MLHYGHVEMQVSGLIALGDFGPCEWRVTTRVKTPKRWIIGNKKQMPTSFAVTWGTVHEPWVIVVVFVVVVRMDPGLALLTGWGRYWRGKNKMSGSTRAPLVRLLWTTTRRRRAAIKSPTLTMFWPPVQNLEPLMTRSEGGDFVIGPISKAFQSEMTSNVTTLGTTRKEVDLVRAVIKKSGPGRRLKGTRPKFVEVDRALIDKSWDRESERASERPI